MKKFRIMTGAVLAGGWALLFICLNGLGDCKTRVWFLDVGQGDAVFIRAAGGETALIDGGPDDAVLRELSEVMPFYEKTIDLVVLTHPHADHVDGLVLVLKRYDVRNVLITGVAGGDAGYKEFLNIVAEKDIPVLYAKSETDYRLGVLVMDILYPRESIAGERFENLNLSSITMRFFAGGEVFFLSGDLEVEGEKELIESGQDLSADVFKAGHHGSRTASTLDLLGKIGADTAVITCGEGNRFDHPHAETLANFTKLGMRIFRTDVGGRVMFGEVTKIDLKGASLL